MTIEVMKQALEALEAGDWYINQLELIVYASDDDGTHENRAKVHAAITALRQAIEQAQPAIPAPPEAQTDGEKTAYAFGWFKALEWESAQPVSADAKDAAKYHELICQVSSKHPGEIRHDTALRHIKNAEQQASKLVAASAAVKEQE